MKVNFLVCIFLYGRSTVFPGYRLSGKNSPSIFKGKFLQIWLPYDLRKPKMPLPSPHPLRGRSLLQRKKYASQSKMSLIFELSDPENPPIDVSYTPNALQGKKLRRSHRAKMTYFVTLWAKSRKLPQVKLSASRRHMTSTMDPEKIQSGTRRYKKILRFEI